MQGIEAWITQACVCIHLQKKMIEIVWFEHQVSVTFNAWEGVKASY